MAPTRSHPPRVALALVSAALGLMTACGANSPSEAGSELPVQGAPLASTSSSEHRARDSSASPSGPSPQFTDAARDSSSSPELQLGREQTTRAQGAQLQALSVSQAELDLGTPDRPILLRPAKPQDIAPPSPFPEQEAGEPDAELRQAQAEAVARARAIAEACEAGRAAAAQGSISTPSSPPEDRTDLRDESQDASKPAKDR